MPDAPLKLAITLAVVVSFPAAASADAGPTVQFALPAQVGGDLGAEGAAWMLVLSAEVPPTAFILTGTESHVVTEYERVSIGEHKVSNVGSHQGYEEETAGDPAPMPPRVELSGQDGASSFYAEGRLGLSVQGAEAVLDVPTGACLSWFDTLREERATRSDALCPASWPAVAVRPAAGQTLTFHASGSEAGRFQWHNLAPRCEDAAPCPAAGTRDDRTVPLTGQDYVRTSTTRFEESAGPATAAFTGSGEATLVIFGGSGLDLAVDGWVRLPLASSDGGCATCVSPDDQTLSARGSVVLGDLRPQDGRLSSRLSGDLGSARFDETPVSPDELFGTAAIAAGAVVAGIGLLVLAKSLLVPLFTRVTYAKATENANRKNVLDQIAVSPGATLRGLARATGLARGTVRHHVSILVKLGLVTEVAKGNTMRHFPVGMDRARMDAASVLQDPWARQLWTRVLEQPGVTQGQLIQLGADAPPRSTIQFKLRQLAEAGVLVATKVGRQVIYSPTPRFSSPHVLASPAPRVVAGAPETS